MTNQSQQPLTLKLSNGQEVSVPTGKSVLQFTDNGQPRSCAIVRGPNGVAIYNAEGDVQINGAPSSAHWLQPGDELQFGDSLTASVEQLGVASEALDSLLNESTQSAVPTAPEQATPAQTPITNEQNSFTPATEATDFASQVAAPVPTPAESQVPSPVEAPAPVANTQDNFTPATEAIASAIEPQATPVAPAVPEVSSPDAPSAMDLAAPAVTGAAALAASAMSMAGAFDGQPSAPQAPVTEAPTAQPEISGFAAELLARIQADDNENETVGTTASETTHSPLAADGPSFSSSVPDAATSDASSSISSLIPELPQTSAPAPVAETEPTVEEPSHIETTTAESSERQMQSSSVSDLLERMKSEGQLDIATETEETSQADATSEPEAAPAFADADDDVQNYMSQLLSRMRDPNAPPQAAATAAPAATPASEQQQQQVVQQAVERPKTVGLLKPEEFVPKNKAKRLDSLQEMRALANTQTRTAIDRSQAKRMEAVDDTFTLAIAIACCITAAIVFFFNIFGGMSFAVGMTTMIIGAFFCCKIYFSELIGLKKADNKRPEEEAVQEIPQEVVQEAV